MELCETVGRRRCIFQLVLLQEGHEDILTLLLHLAVVTTQDGLDLGLGLGGGDEVDPRRTDML